MEPLETGVNYSHGQESEADDWNSSNANPCRVCGVYTDFLVPIFGGEGLQHQLDHKIHMYLHLQVLRNDVLPLHLCYDCLSTILSWHSLYLKCQEADDRFRTMFGLKDQVEVPGRSVIILSSETPELSSHNIPHNSHESSNSYPTTCLSEETQPESSQPSCIRGVENNSDQGLHNRVSDQPLDFYSKIVNMKQSSVLVTKGSLNSISEGSVATPFSPLLEEDKKTSHFSNQVSAIQLTSHSNVLPLTESSCSRSKSVLVRNESVHPSSEERSACATIPDISTFNEASVIKEHRNVGNTGDSGSNTMVSVVRPTCLRRAPTAVIAMENFEESSDFSTQNEMIVPNLVSDITLSQNSPSLEDKIVDLSHTCFHCKKFISNPVLMLAHEKSHLTDINPPTTFKCKFCSNFFESIVDLHLHYSVHESDLERQHRNHSNRKAYLCKQCGLFCSTEERLSAHLRLHTDSGEITRHECKTCGENFSTRSKLSVHLWTHALKPSLKTFKCHICGKGFGTKSSVIEHRLKHTNEEKSRAFKCVICGMAFGNNTLLGRHRATHSEEELARPFKCTFCCKAFARNHTLQIHYLSHSEEKSHLCSHCGKGFKMRNSLIQHLRTHQDPSIFPTHSCHICGKSFRVKSRLQDHLRVHSGDRPFKCTVCGKCFHKINALHTHEVSHTERRPYKCDLCGKAFKWRKNLHQHRSVHDSSKELQQIGSVLKSPNVLKTKKEQYRCEICGEQLSGKSNLTQHVSSVHGIGVSKYPKMTICSICGKELSRPGALLRHMKSTHGGEKAFKCDLCDREYTTKVARDDHRRSHTGERPYTCSACPKTFTSLSNLHIHRSTHSEDRPHKCTYCGKQFKRRAHLIPHIRTHTGEKPYVCDICSRGFAQSNDLHKHRLTHSTSKSYSCDCGMAFRVKRDLTRHKLKHHPYSLAQPSVLQVDIQSSRTDSVVKKMVSTEPLTLLPGQNQHSSTISYSGTATPSVVVRNTEVLATYSNQQVGNLTSYGDNYL